MMTAQLMKSMDDRHLVASVHAELDPLTSSAAEIELLARFEALLDERNDELKGVVEYFDFEVKDIRALGDALIQNTDTTVALLNTIAKAGIEDPESLKAELDLAKKFRDLIEDAGDVFTRLSDLLTTQE
jgi:hypothetical protein